MRPDVAKFADAAGVSVESKLGASRYRTVYRVRRDGDVYALKLATSEPTAQIRELFWREAIALARAQHPLLPTAWTVGNLEEWPYLVTDLIPGRSLDEWLKSGPVDPNDAVHIALDMLRGVGALHDHGYIHANLTPESVIWDQRQARIADFGRTIQPDHNGDESDDDDDPETGYLSPEQSGTLNRLPDERSDLFSVGTILFECLTGEPLQLDPPTKTGDSTFSAARIRQTIDEALADQVSSNLREILGDVLEIEPDRRPPDARETQRRLADTPEVQESHTGTSPGQHALPAHSTASDSERIAQARQLERQWQKVHRRGRGALSLITGDPGIGKSNLLDTLTGNVTPAPARIARATCSVTATSPLELIHNLITTLTDDDSQPNESADASLQFPALEADGPNGLADISSEDIGLSRDSSSATVHEPATLARRVLEAGRTTHGIIIAVERIERADANTIGVLQRIAMSLGRTPIHLIVTSNDEQPDGHAARIWASAASAGNANPDRPVAMRQRIQLTPFNRHETGNYLQDYLGRTVADDTIVDAVYETSNGNPLLTAEYADILLREFAIKPDWPGWVRRPDQMAKVAFDSDAKGLLRRRLEELDEPVLELCRLAAVWGDSITTRMAAEATSTSSPAAQNRLETAATHGVLIRQPLTNTDGDTCYRFRTRTYRDILEESLDPSEHESLHQQLARAGIETGASTFSIALHLARGDGADPDLTYSYCLRAGWQAHQGHAYNQAVDLLVAAESACTQLDRRPPAELLYLLGHAYIETEKLERGRQKIRKAIERTPRGAQKARYQTGLNESLVSGFQLERLEDGVRAGLDWADAPLPQTKFGLTFAILWMILRYGWWRLVGSPRITDPDEIDRHRLLAKMYHHLSIASTGMSRTLLTVYSQFARLLAAHPIGPSYELVVAQSSFGYVLGIAGKPAWGHRLLERAAETAADADSERARTRVDLMRGLHAEVDGRPLESERQLTEVLHERSDQLQFSDRILALQNLIWNLSMRGQSHKVLDWYHWWRERVEVEAISADNPRASMLFSFTMWNARLLGRDALADDLRDRSEHIADPTTWPAAELAHQTGVLRDNLIKVDFDGVRTSLETMHDPLEGDILWTRATEMTRALARMRLYEHGRSADLRADYQTAVEELADLESDHPILRCHTAFHRARLALIAEDHDTFNDHLGRAEQLASHLDDRWIGMEIARLRARWLDEHDLPESERHHARQAVERAHRGGWVRETRRLRQAFSLSSLDERETDKLEAIDADNSEEDADAIPKSLRQLSALIDASLATHNAVDNADPRETALRAAIRALGAGRGAVIEAADPRGDAESFDLQITSTYAAAGADDADDPVEPDSLPWEIIEQVVRADEPRSLTEQDLDGYRQTSILAVPLKADPHIRGVVYVDNRDARGLFDDSDIDVLRAIANQLAAALAKRHFAKLEVEVEVEREQRAYAERLQAFFADVSASLDLFDISERLVRELLEFLDGDRAFVVSFHQDEAQLAATGTGADIDSGPFDTAHPPSVADPDWADLKQHLENEAPTWVEDSERDIALTPFTDDTIRSWVALPLRSDDELTGFAIVGCDRTHAFSSSDIQQAQTFAAQAAVAIDRVQLATFDDLTGLHNRRKFFDYADRHWRAVTSGADTLSVLLIDIDDFKQINDTHGHAIGDRVLSQVATVCRQSLRDSDTIARYGGEEFAVLIPSTDLDSAADIVADRILHEVRDLRVPAPDDSQLTVTISIGAAEYHDADTSIDDLLDRADQALYRAKSTGKNRTVTADPPS